MAVSRLFSTIYWIWIASEVLTIVLTRTRRSSGETRDRGSVQVLWVVIFGSIWVGLGYGAAHPHTIAHGAHWVLGLGLAVFLVGVLLRWTAILTLGKSFSVNVAIHAAQTVKKDGLYRYVRHPSYSALLLIFAGLGLETRNWISFAIILVLPALALLYRMHVEEHALRTAFGDDYAGYCRRTRRLIPWVY